MKRKIIFLTFILTGCIIFGGCSVTPAEKATRPKYVFLFIGDGMGFAHVTATEDYLAAKDTSAGNLSFTGFPVTGMVTTYSANTLVTCSSAAATALATGHKTNNNMLGVAPDGEKLTALTYPLQQAGFKIGIATSVSIDHATPAGFYANALKRNSYYDIASQAGATGFDFFAGSGFLGTEKEEKPGIYEQLTTAGYRIVYGPEGALQVAPEEKTVLVQVEEKPVDALPYAIDRKEDDLTLPQITQAAIKALHTSQSGFFVMIEGGKIDWAAHTNDGATVIREVIDFSNAVQIAVDFYKKYPTETLILVTADHETGGMSVGYDGVYAFHPLVFDEQTRSLPNKPTEKEKEFVKELNKKVLCGWTSTNHTGCMVPIFAIGVGSEQFAGKMNNTDIPKRISQLMGVVSE